MEIRDVVVGERGVTLFDVDAQGYAMKWHTITAMNCSVDSVTIYRKRLGPLTLQRCDEVPVEDWTVMVHRLFEAFPGGDQQLT